MRLRPIIDIYAAIIDDAAAGSEGAVIVASIIVDYRFVSDDFQLRLAPFVFLLTDLAKYTTLVYNISWMVGCITDLKSRLQF